MNCLRFYLGVLGLFLMATWIKAQPGELSSGKVRVYIGTYTGKASQGIYRVDMDLTTGSLSKAELAAAIANPSFLAIHPNQKFLYSVNEIGNFGGKKAGAISAFAIDTQTGNLTLLSQKSSVGDGPCHLVVDQTGKNVLAANYGGGSACVLRIEPDGKLTETTSFVQHHGSSVNPKRQKEPHAHSINLDSGNKFAFVADLGLDQVRIYQFDSGKGTLTAHKIPFVSLDPGAGPRHFAFHPNGRFAYVINELHNTITTMSYVAQSGELITSQTVTTLPNDFKGTSYTAEVVVHPSGKFVYGSNRGHDSIAIFGVDVETGKLSTRVHQNQGIKTPRNFAIDPTGTYLLVANQGSGNVLVFRIDQKTGNLTPTQNSVAVPTPVCLRFLRLEN